MAQVDEASRGRVALVDDDGSVRKALDRLLSAAGYQVRAFHSAESFIEEHGVQDAQCLIVDMRMAGMSGADLQTYLAYQGVRIPIVFITGYADEPARTSVIRLGAFAYLHKPVDEVLLLETLDRARAEYERCL